MWIVILFYFVEDLSNYYAFYNKRLQTLLRFYHRNRGLQNVGAQYAAYQTRDTGANPNKAPDSFNLNLNLMTIHD